MLARLNPGVDPAEIKNLQTHQASLEEALTETRYRLDSLHLVVVESWGGGAVRPTFLTLKSLPEVVLQ